MLVAGANMFGVALALDGFFYVPISNNMVYDQI